jgi:hypothetical protein
MYRGAQPDAAHLADFSAFLGLQATLLPMQHSRHKLQR